MIPARYTLLKCRIGARDNKFEYYGNSNILQHRMDVLITKLSVVDRIRPISIDIFVMIRPSAIKRIEDCITAVQNCISADDIVKLSKKRSTEKIYESSGPAREHLYRLHAALVLLESFALGIDGEINYP